MGNTPSGIPYPEESDMLSNGASAMKDLAIAVDGTFVKKTGDTVVGSLDVQGAISTNDIAAKNYVYVKNGGVYRENSWLLGGAAQLEVYGQGATNPGVLTTIAHGNATYNNQSATLGQVIYIHAASSERLKERISPLSAEEATAFDALTPKSFTRTDTGNYELGFIAEDVQAAGLPVVTLPHGVVPDVEGEVLGYSDRTLIAVLWAKVQEQEKRIQALEAKLD